MKLKMFHNQQYISKNGHRVKRLKKKGKKQYSSIPTSQSSQSLKQIFTIERPKSAKSSATNKIKIQKRLFTTRPQSAKYKFTVQYPLQQQQIIDFQKNMMFSGYNPNSQKTRSQKYQRKVKKNTQKDLTKFLRKRNSFKQQESSLQHHMRKAHFHQNQKQYQEQMLNQHFKDYGILQRHKRNPSKTTQRPSSGYSSKRAQSARRDRPRYKQNQKQNQSGIRFEIKRQKLVLQTDQIVGKTFILGNPPRQYQNFMSTSKAKKSKKYTTKSKVKKFKNRAQKSKKAGRKQKYQVVSKQLLDKYKPVTTNDSEITKQNQEQFKLKIMEEIQEIRLMQQKAIQQLQNSQNIQNDEILKTLQNSTQQLEKVYQKQQEILQNNLQKGSRKLKFVQNKGSPLRVRPVLDQQNAKQKKVEKIVLIKPNQKKRKKKKRILKRSKSSISNVNGQNIPLQTKPTVGDEQQQQLVINTPRGNNQNGSKTFLTKIKKVESQEGQADKNVSYSKITQKKKKIITYNKKQRSQHQSQKSQKSGSYYQEGDTLSEDDENDYFNEKEMAKQTAKLSNQVQDQLSPNSRRRYSFANPLYKRVQIQKQFLNEQLMLKEEKDKKEKKKCYRESARSASGMYRNPVRSDSYFSKLINFSTEVVTTPMSNIVFDAIKKVGIKGCSAADIKQYMSDQQNLYYIGEELIHQEEKETVISQSSFLKKKEHLDVIKQKMSKYRKKVVKYQKVSHIKQEYHMKYQKYLSKYKKLISVERKIEKDLAQKVKVIEDFSDSESLEYNRLDKYNMRNLTQEQKKERLIKQQQNPAENFKMEYGSNNLNQQYQENEIPNPVERNPVEEEEDKEQKDEDEEQKDDGEEDPCEEILDQEAEIDKQHEEKAKNLMAIVPHLKMEVIKLAIQQKNGNSDEAVIMLLDEFQVQRLQKQVDEKKKKDEEAQNQKELEEEMPSKEDDDVLVVEEKPIGDEGGEEEEEKLSKEGIEND